MTTVPHPTLIELPAELRGERVVVRPYRAEDAESVYAAIDESREHLRPWMDWVDKHRSVDDARVFCLRSAAQWLLRENMPLGIFGRDDGRYLGGTGFHEPDWELRSFAIGYWLRASATGHGYTTETVRLLSDVAFGPMAARRLEITCDANNEPSRRVAERCGFVFEGRLRNYFLSTSGAPGDRLVFSLTPADREPTPG